MDTTAPLIVESTENHQHFPETNFGIWLLQTHTLTVHVLVRSAGFLVAPRSLSYPYLRWSREDLGLLDRVLKITPDPVREETLINPFAVKPRV